MVANDIFARVKNSRTSERSEQVSEFLTSAKVRSQATFHDKIYLSYAYAPLYVTVKLLWYNYTFNSTHRSQYETDVRSFDVVFTKLLDCFI